MRADARFCASSSCTRRGRCFATTPRSSTCERPCRSVTLAPIPSPSFYFVRLCVCAGVKERERESMSFIPWQTSHGITTPVHKNNKGRNYTAQPCCFSRDAARMRIFLHSSFLSPSLFTFAPHLPHRVCIFVSHSGIISVN